MLKVFVSYSHKDEDWRRLLATHLKPLERSGLIQVWHDRKLLGGDRFDDVIDGRLEEADLVLLLVSADFINSDYCYGRELTRALERERNGQTRVLPVILRACRWTALPFGKLNAAPTDGRPVAEWADRDTAMDNVAEAVERIAKVRANPGHQPAAERPNTGRKTERDRPRPMGVPSNRKPSDQDKDDFRIEAFHTIREAFEEAIAQLPTEQGLSGRIDALDKRRFIVVVYRNGKRVAGLTVFTGGEHFGHQSICYSGDESGGTNSMNEQLSIDNDEKGLFLRPLMGGMHGKVRPRLSPNEAAEYFWEKFVEPLAYK